MRFRHSLLLLLPLALSGCAIVAGTAAGVVLAHEVVDGSTYVVQLELPAEVVWEETRVSFSNQAEGPLHVDESLKAAEGKVDGRSVTVSVEAFDQETSRLIVNASRFGVADGETADDVATAIVKDIKEQAR